MKIERSNILELIGTGKNKYHSCVITSYSIDLAFFEQLILPRLRSAGITNINLFTLINNNTFTIFMKFAIISLLCFKTLNK